MDFEIKDGGSKFVTSGDENGISGGSRSGVTSGDNNGIEGWGGIDAGSRTLLGGDWG